jgi:DNA polymerase elongation subunit (family B)
MPLYGLDIETDTTVNGLDPDVAAVVAVAIAGESGNAVLTHPDEAELLRDVAGLLGTLPAGVLVTWNGATFDLPFLDTRARLHGVDLGLQLQADSQARTRYRDDPHYRGTFRASWHQHRHLDAFRVYRNDVGRTLGLSCGLKALSRLVGLDPVSVDASRIHDLTPAELREYVASDAHCARELALRRWATASRAVDPFFDPRTDGPSPHAPMPDLTQRPDLTPRVGALR